MIITALLLGLLFVVYIIGRINLQFQFHKQVSRLFAESKNISAKTFNYSQLIDLPNPVQRYFKHVLKDGQPYISYARIKHNGQFRAGLTKGWADIKGEQYATTEKPGFIWKGVTSIFTARDMFIAGKGRLIVSLFNIFNVVDAQGPQYDQGEILRWLGESILYPTNLLPDQRLQWHTIDDKSAKLFFSYLNFSLFFIITFNETGEITQMETKRYMDEKNEETWIIKLIDYKVFNDICIPTFYEVLWRLEKGDFTYAKFNLQKIEYNKPLAFGR
jgi:hypothetical protein